MPNIPSLLTEKKLPVAGSITSGQQKIYTAAGKWQDYQTDSQNTAATDDKTGTDATLATLSAGIGNESVNGTTGNTSATDTAATGSNGSATQNAAAGSTADTDTAATADSKQDTAAATVDPAAAPKTGDSSHDKHTYTLILLSAAGAVILGKKIKKVQDDHE